MIKNKIASKETVYLRFLASRKLHVKEQLCDVIQSLITNTMCLIHYSMKITMVFTLMKYSTSISIGIDAFDDGFIITTIQHIVYRSTFIYIFGSKNKGNDK